MMGISRQLGYALSGDQRFRVVGRITPKLQPKNTISAPIDAKSSKTINPVSNPKRIQVFRRHALGDVLLATPILRKLREKFPDDEIVMSTYFPDIIENNPHIDSLVRSEKPLDGFDMTITLDYECTPDQHIVDSFAQIAEVSVGDKTPEIYLTQQDLTCADALLRDSGIDLDSPICAFHMQSGWPVRDWPIRHFRAMARELEAEGVQIIVLGKETEPEIDFGIDLRGKTEVREAAAVLFKCTAMVTVDSSLMHFAYAMRRPTVAIFGCTNPENRVPDWALPMTIYADIVCKGCHHRQRPVPAIFAPVCPWDTVRCMEETEPAKALELVRKALACADNPKVSIIIPHFNNFEILEQCLWSIFRVGADIEFEVIVVDDGSTDDSVKSLQVWQPRVRVIRNLQNLGFAATCNAGAREARGEFILFLNNDTTVMPHWLDELFEVLNGHDEIGAVGPKLLYPDGQTIQHCGTVFNENGLGEHLYRYLPANFVAANRQRFFRALTGACLMIRRQEFHDLGGFDEEFQMGGEDTDLCFKLRERDKFLVYCPKSMVLHHEGLSRGLRDENHPVDVFNRDLLIQRWEKYLTPDIADYCLLAEIEEGESKTWNWLADVPPDIVAQYDSSSARQVGRFPFRCEIGSGMHPEPGYIHLDVIEDAPSLDIIHDILNPLPFPDNTVREILASHVIEHVTWHILPKIVKEFFRVLVPEGQVFIRTPNLQFIMEHYQSGEITPEHPDDEQEITELYGAMTPGLWANVKLFSGQDYPSNFHMFCMDPNDLRMVFVNAGFTTVNLKSFGREYSPGEIQLVAIK